MITSSNVLHSIDNFMLKSQLLDFQVLTWGIATAEEIDWYIPPTGIYNDIHCTCSSVELQLDPGIILHDMLK